VEQTALVLGEVKSACVGRLWSATMTSCPVAGREGVWREWKERAM